MKRVICLVLAIASICVSGEMSKLDSLMDAEKYQDVISYCKNTSNDLSAKDSLALGKAYYTLEKDQQAYALFKELIKADATNSSAFYYLGKSEFFMGKYKDAVQSLSKSVQLDSTKASAYTGLADAYEKLGDTKNATKNFRIAITKDGNKNRAYAMLGYGYIDLNMNDSALHYFRVAKNNLPKEARYYPNILYNLGLYEYLYGNLDSALAVYKELELRQSKDFEVMKKIIQVYYAKKEYEKAEPYRTKLYEAKKAGELKGELEQSFCFDQFDWKEYRVFVFEDYRDSDDKLFYKVKFNFVNKSGDIEFSIQTEYSPIAKELGSVSWLLGMSSKNMHKTFNQAYKEHPEYEVLLSHVMKALEGEIGVGGSTRFNLQKN